MIVIINCHRDFGCRFRGHGSVRGTEMHNLLGVSGRKGLRGGDFVVVVIEFTTQKYPFTYLDFTTNYHKEKIFFK